MLRTGINNRTRSASAVARSRKDRRRALFITPLEDILQSKLQDSRIERCPKDAKRVAGQGRVGISRPEGVCQIERLDPEFQPLAFTETKCPRHGHIKRPGCRATNGVAAHISQRTQIRKCESSRFQERG